MKELFRKSLAVLSVPEKKRLAVLMFFTILISVADIAFLALLLFITDFYISPAAAMPGWLPHWFSNDGSVIPVLVFFILFSLKNYSGFIIYKSYYRFVHQVASRISRHNLLHYLEGNYAGFVKTDSSVHIRRISLQPLEFCQYVLAGLHQVITESILVLLAIIAILLFNAKLFLLLLVILLPPVLITTWYTRKKLETARNWLKNSRQQTWQHLQEAISGFVESNIYDKNLFFTDRYAKAQRSLNYHQSTLHSMQGLPARLAEVFAVFGLLALVIISRWPGNDFNIPGLVTLGAFLAAAYKIIPGISRILNAAGQVRTFAFTLDNLVTRPARTHEAPTGTAVTPIHSITCCNMGFRFEQMPVLNNFHMELRSGDLVGIDAPSGKGKTTLINILLGFLEPQQGTLLFNQQPACSNTRRQFRSRIAYVKQQPFIIHDSLLTNITLSTNGYDASRLQQVLTATGLQEWVDQDPRGMNRVLAENGKNISGGQRQRVALARALYKNADLYILDEPFSELDEPSEKTLLQHFKQLSARGKIIILVTHNRHSLTHCSRIITL